MTRRTVGAWASMLLTAASLTGCMSTGAGSATATKPAAGATAKAAPRAQHSPWASTAAVLGKQAPKTTATAAPIKDKDKEPASAIAQASAIAPPAPPAEKSGLTPPQPLSPPVPAPLPQAAALAPNASSLKSLTAGTAAADPATKAPAAQLAANQRAADGVARTSLPVPVGVEEPTAVPALPGSPGPMDLALPVAVPPSGLTPPAPVVLSSPPPLPVPTKVRPQGD